MIINRIKNKSLRTFCHSDPKKNSVYRTQSIGFVTSLVTVFDNNGLEDPLPFPRTPNLSLGYIHLKIRILHVGRGVSVC